MSGLGVDHVYRYRDASELDRGSGALRLATSSRGSNEHPHFFSGELAHAERTAKLLLSLMAVVHARFHVPAARRLAGVKGSNKLARAAARWA